MVRRSPAARRRDRAGRRPPAAASARPAARRGPPVASPTAASTAARSRGRRSRPRQATASEAVSTTRRRRAASPDRRPRSRRRVPPVPSSVSSGLSRIVATGPEGHRGHPPGLGQRSVLPLRVDHPRLAPEHGLAPQVRLDERALAPADLSDDHHVRVGDHPVPVEGEGVVDERARRARPARSGRPRARGRPRSPTGRRRTGGGWWPHGRAPGARRAVTIRPRPSGRVQAKATSCSP